MILQIAIVAILGFMFCYVRQTDRRLPPGPINFPIIGNLNWLRKFPWIHLVTLRKIYGPIATIKLGRTNVYVLNDIATWKEAYRQEEFSRHPGKVFESVLENKSIIFSNGNPEMKQFIIKALNDFGKHTSENRVLEEIEILLKKLEGLKANPVQVQTLFSFPTLNVLWSLLLGKRINDDDQIMHEFLKMNYSAATNSSVFGRQSLLHLIPYISRFFTSKSRSEIIRGYLTAFVNEFRERIQDHAKTRRNFEVRDITDSYFDKVEQTDPMSGSAFAGGDSLHFIFTGMFLAGADSTSTGVEWLVYFLAINPSVQVQFQAEIDNVIGNRKPSLADRNGMPYTLAIIQEMFRLATIDIAQFHQTKADTKLLGYDIPKGSIVVPNVYGISHDPDIWNDPYIFKPGRFIDVNGKFVASDQFITFGLGRRSCPGESFSKNQLFLFITSIFQHYNVKLHGKDPTLFGEFGVAHHPKQFDAVFENRNNRLEKS